MSTLPQALSPGGEVIRLVTAEHLLQAAGITDPRAAETEALAEFSGNADHLTGIAREAKTVVGEELVRRLDRAGKWTRREGPWTIKSASPEAGTTAYDHERLVEAVQRLVADDLIDQEAADAALEPVPGTVAFTADDLRLLLATLQCRLDPPDHAMALALVERSLAFLPATTYRQKHAGIKALLKISREVAKAIDECRIEVTPAPRVAKVTRAT